MGQALNLHRRSHSRLTLLSGAASLPIIAALAGALTPSPAFAACSSNAPASNTTVICDGLDTTGVINAAADQVIVTVLSTGTISTASGSAISLHDQNAITNNGAIVVTTSTNGIFVNGTGGGSTVTNNGTITFGDGSIGISALYNNIITNNGTMTGGNGGIGIRVDGLSGGNTVVNNGTITVGNDSSIGVELFDPGNTLVNAGTIIAGNAVNSTVRGVFADDKNSTVVNIGKIIVGNATGADASAVEFNFNGTSSSLTNTGTIKVGDATAAIAAAVRINTAGVVVNNSGLIQAGASGYSIFAGSAATVVNSGTLDGGLALFAASSSVTNSGLITVTNSGTPVGVFHEVAGDFTQTASGTLALRVNAVPNYDFIRALGGTATLDGTLTAVVKPGLYANSTTYPTIVFGSLGVAGTFSTVSSTSPFFTAAATYGANAVDLTLNRIAFNAVSGLNANQIAVATALETSYSTALTGNAATFYGNLLASTQNPGTSYTQLSGEGLSQAQQSAFFASTLFMSSILDQALLGHGGGGPGGDQAFSYAEDGEALGYGPRRKKGAPAPFNSMPAAPPQAMWRVWLAGFGGKQSLDGDPAVGSASSTLNTWGGGFGIEKRIDSSMILGLALGASDSRFSVPDRSTDGTATGAHIGIYGVKNWGAAYLAGVLSYSHLSNLTTRTVTGIGTSDTYQGKFGTDQLGARFELGYRFALSSYNVTPFAAVQVTQVWQDAFSESPTTGPGIFALTLPAQSQTSLPIFLGAQLDTQYAVGGMTLAPYLRAAWVHETKPDRSITAGFTSVPGSSFTVDGPRPDSESVKIDAGAKLALSRTWSAFGNFSSELASHGHTYAASGGVKAAW